MRSHLKLFAVLIAPIVISAMLPKQSSAQQGAVDFQVFYDQLSPYGQWVDNPTYGYVWIPNAGPDFVPYFTGGQWVLSDDGWTWVSDYDWGWAPFHYGRWDYDNVYGWFWVPDNVWGPSWVTWRQGNGYYGWAPMRPGVSIEVSFGGSYNMPDDRWTFVRDRDIRRRHVDQYRVDRASNVTIIQSSSVINRTYTDNGRHAVYVAGPNGSDVQKATGKPIKLVSIQDNNKPGQALSHGQLQMYRPEVRSGNGQKPAPSHVVGIKDVKSPSERTVQTMPRNVGPPNNIRGQQQPVRPRNANPTVNSGKGQQPQTVNPQPNQRGKQQPPMPGNTNPSVNKVRGPQRQTVNPPSTNRGKQQPVSPRKANPPVNDAKKQQQQNVKPPQKNDNGKNQQTKPMPNHDNKG
ncbi:MAG TPA: DUF6600 domain-containing protein [Candidatus Kryptonia bacterium]